MTTLTLQPIPVDLDDEFACDINAFENALLLELDPGAPPMPVAMTKAYARHHDPEEQVAALAARDSGGRVVGTIWMSAPITGNTHLAFCRLGVAADSRRAGVATALVHAYVAFARELERPTLLFGADLLHPSGQAFADALGASVALRAHINRLPLAEVPDGLVARWMATAFADGGAARDYELVWVPDSEFPDAWLADLAVVSDVLVNDAPMDDIPVVERRTTHEQLRAHAARAVAMGNEFWTLVARLRATGEPVGYTEVFFPQHNPSLCSQGATAVSAKHRGHAIGRWLKATMLDRVQRERPEVTEIRTFNADSNDPMLAINHAMGFVPLHEAIRWRMQRSDAEQWLEARP